MKKTKTINMALSFLFIVALMVAFMAVLQPEQSKIQASSSRYIGINVGNTLDDEGNLIFADAIKSAPRFRNSNDSADVAVDSNGWPTVSSFAVKVWSGLAKANGTYALSFEGQASVTISQGGGTLSAVDYNPTTKKSTATLVYTDTSASSSLRLVFTGASHTTASGASTPGVVNIKLMRPISQGSTTSHAPSEHFSRAYKALAGKFKAFRFMDFTATNSKLAEINWSDRVKPTYASQASPQTTGYGWEGKGAAWEYVTLMCNELDGDAWICIPVSASNDYITQLAYLFKYGSDGSNPYHSAQSNPVYPGLETGRKLYIEFSNELWNTDGAFKQTTWLKDKAAAEIAAGGSNLNYDGTTDTRYLGWRLQARRTVEISNLFREVWGDANMMTVVRPVLAWERGNGDNTALAMLPFLEKWYGNLDGNHVTTPRPVNYYIYGGGGSAYYNPDNYSDSLSLSNIWTSQLFDVANWTECQKMDASLCTAFGLKHLAYEGGPNMDNMGHSETVKKQAWNDPRMKTLILDHHNLWEQYDGDLLMYFTIGGGGWDGYYQWNFANDIYNPVNTSPKMQAIEALNSGSPAATTLGTVAPGTRNAGTWDLDNRGWKNPNSGAIVLSLTKDSSGYDPLTSTSYHFRTSTSGSYCVTVSYSSSNNVSVAVLVDGQNLGSITGQTNGAATKFTSPAKTLAVGLHSVKLVCKTGPVTINTISLLNSSTPPTQPTASPTVMPTATPTVKPSIVPTIKPTASPSGNMALLGTPVASVMGPTGQGNHDIKVIKDGVKPAAGTRNLSQQYDTYVGNGARHSEYIGYTFSSAKRFSKLVFQEGVHFYDGGWFSYGAPKVQVRQNGAWINVAASMSPSYPYSNRQRNFGSSFESYTFTFTSVTGDGIRIIGSAGGSAHFISVGELEVY